MNIVWLTPEIPFPPYGGRNGVFHRIEQLSRYNKIFLFSIAYSEEEKARKGEMERYCAEVHYYNRNESPVKKLVKSVLLPYSVASRTMRAITRDIEGLRGRVNLDVIIVDFPNMAMNILKFAKDDIFITLNQHNTEYRRMRDMVKIRTISKIKRLVYYLESFRLELYETWLYRSGMLKAITFFSEGDMALFQKKWATCRADLKVFPLGADRIECGPAPGKHQLLFVGRLDEVAVTNVEAVLWFCEAVLPRIANTVPDVKFIVAGANPSERILDLASEHIAVIPNYRELKDVYSQADCVVLPLLSGGGVKGKLLEAAAMKRIIVTTSRGIEGTRFRQGEHVLLADESKEFADACAKALLTPSNCADLVAAAYVLFERYYDWETIGEKYNCYLQERLQISHSERDSFVGRGQRTP